MDTTWHLPLAHDVARLLGGPVAVYGSVATGEVDAASDLDVVAVVERPEVWAEVAQLTPLGALDPPHPDIA
ncbi:nucleotidyltransferase domain-containing protein [Aestuariimicrobium ganziense]|uniref:nucleotidyltransferase domain-containing protein n=1 Tax=Aestuariimicrobium ganziense TaxID=2773677 RepID=UPI001942EB66|nr:nucleotidyltransferase domain-containing protein [Aestuariimicrobium ganziense]